MSFLFSSLSSSYSWSIIIFLIFITTKPILMRISYLSKIYYHICSYRILKPSTEFLLFIQLQMSLYFYSPTLDFNSCGLSTIIFLFFTYPQLRVGVTRIFFPYLTSSVAGSHHLSGFLPATCKSYSEMFPEVTSLFRILTRGVIFYLLEAPRVSHLHYSLEDNRLLPRILQAISYLRFLSYRCSSHRFPLPTA